MLHWRLFLPRFRAVHSRTALAGGAASDRGKEGFGNVIAYEILLLLDPDVPEERQNEILTRARELVERGGGTWRRHDVWGRRKLAYEIRHKGEGVYHLLTIDCEPATLDELSRILRITDGVMRHMATQPVRGASSAAPAPPPADIREPEYAAANTRSREREE
jgi:small subunit ribosomal protein S6